MGRTGQPWENRLNRRCLRSPPMILHCDMDITHELWQTADEMLCQRLPPGRLPVRLLGMGVGGFDEAGLRQGLLFDQDGRGRQARLDAVSDEIRERFGSSALHRAAWLSYRRGSRSVDHEGGSGACERQ